MRTRTTFAAAGLIGALAIAPIASAQPAATDLPAETTAATGEMFWLNEARTHYVPSKDAIAKDFSLLDAATRERSVPVDVAAIAGLAGFDTAGLKAPDAAPSETPLSKRDVDPASEHPVAAGLIALPAVLTIGETTYYLNKDGHTYVTDMGRIAEEPTQEEKDASNALLSEHSAEVARQAIAEVKAGNGEGVRAVEPASLPGADAAKGAPGVTVERTAGGGEAPAPASVPAPAPQTAEAPAPEARQVERGMAAQTGSNALAKALCALVIASLIGAGFFAVVRRRLV